MQTEADRIAMAIQRIREGAMLRPASKRAAYVAENIRRQQENAKRFVMARKPPAGWSVEVAGTAVSASSSGSAEVSLQLPV